MVVEHPTRAEQYVKVPIPRPPPLQRHEDLGVATGTRKPSESNYTDNDALDGLRSQEKTETYVKLFYARYFTITGDQLSTSIGVDLSAANDKKLHKDLKERLVQNFVRQPRVKAFGPRSYLSGLVQHIVEQRDFEVLLFNIALRQRKLGIAPTGESTRARTDREASVKLHQDLKAHKLEGLAASRQNVVDLAEKELERVQNLKIKMEGRQSKIKTARLVLEHAKAQNKAWEPSIDVSFTSREQLPKPRDRYCEMEPDITQAFWEEQYDNDIGAAMLWQVKDVINIPATLAANEEFYKAVFVVFAMNVSKLCGGVSAANAYLQDRLAMYGITGVNMVLEGERLRADRVYKSMAAVNRTFFDDIDGLDMLRISKSSSTKSGIKQNDEKESFITKGVSFGTKRKRTG
jgi:hypothetical protein